MRLHCISVPHTIASDEFVCCAHTSKIIDFCDMMKKRGHYIIFYGNEGSNVECHEMVHLTSEQELREFYNYDASGNWKQRQLVYSNSDKH